MPRIVHFEIGAKDPERASKFYSEVFNWKINKWDGPMPYWLVTTGEKTQMGIDGGILNQKEGWPTIVNTIDVPNCDEYISKVTKFGGSLVVPKTAVPGVGYMAYLKDTEGNVFGIMQNDENAK